MVLGWHWMATASGCAPERLGDSVGIGRLLGELVDVLGLHAVSEPMVREVERGLVGVVLLSESHVAVHTDRASRRAWVDVFSCAPFREELARRWVRDHLGADGVSSHTVRRGPESPA